MNESVSVSALGGMWVLDLAQNSAAYAGRLLSDLGASVVRLAADGRGDDGAEDFAASFYNAGKLRLSRDAGYTFEETVSQPWDIIFISDRSAEIVGFSVDALRTHNRQATIVSINPYGIEVQKPATDLTVLAAGGLLSLGGYADSEPLAIGGDQSFTAAAVFAAVAALSDMLERKRSGRPGRWIDVSAQECVAFALEDAIPDAYINNTVRRRHGDRAREAGTGVYPCADGFVSIVAGRLGTAKAWTALRQWIIETGSAGSEELADERWEDFSYRQAGENIARFGRIFAAFAARQTKLALYLEGQKRQIAIAPVNGIEDILQDPQLQYSSFFKTFAGAKEASWLIPGPPYRLSATPAHTPDRPSRAIARSELFAQLGSR